MSDGCTAVCDKVIRKLKEAGFKISPVEVCGKTPDWRGLSVSHEDAKGMGGTRRVYLDKDLKMRCGKCHSLKHHIYEF